jgi:hypothetical protein
MCVFGTIMSNMFSFIPANLIALEGISIDLMNSFPLVSVALVSMSVLIFSTPVVMLFVFDKNTGVLEYLLSTGLDQLDLFKGYVKASLSLASILLAFSVVLNTAIGIYLGTSLGFLASMVVLTFAMGISAVLLATVSMMAFSSLQKTQMGAKRALHTTDFKTVNVLLVLMAVGAMGAGVFTKDITLAHGAMSSMAFLFAGLSAMASSKVVKKPLSLISIVLGAMALGALALFSCGLVTSGSLTSNFAYDSIFFLGLGPGGMERMIVYPALMWLAGFGGYLVARQET